MAAPRVLLLDDEPFQLKLLSRQLANLGLDRVDTFTSGQEALTLLEQQASGVQIAHFGDCDRSFRSIMTGYCGSLCGGWSVAASVTMGRRFRSCGAVFGAAIRP